MELNLIQAVYLSLAVLALFYVYRSWTLRSSSIERRRSTYLCAESAALAHQAAGRLFDQRDVELLRRHSPRLVRRLRAERHQAFKLYLGELRREFSTVSRWARESAAANDAPELAAAALKQSVVFYSAYFLLSAQATLGFPGAFPMRPDALLRRIEPLRQAQTAAR